MKTKETKPEGHYTQYGISVSDDIPTIAKKITDYHLPHSIGDLQDMKPKIKMLIEHAFNNAVQCGIYFLINNPNTFFVNQPRPQPTHGEIEKAAKDKYNPANSRINSILGESYVIAHAKKCFIDGCQYILSLQQSNYAPAPKEKEMIEFAEWIRDNYIRPSINYEVEKRWYKFIEGTNEHEFVVTTAELVTLFQQRNK